MSLERDAEELLRTATEHRAATGHNRFRLSCGNYVQEVTCTLCETVLLSAAWHTQKPRVRE